MYDDPLAFFITWTTYGTWLPGDDRGWVKWHQGHQPRDKRLRRAAAKLQRDATFTLQWDQRQTVIATIRDHCAFRNWILHAVDARTNHVHVVVSAPGYAPETAREQLKAWCTRKLKQQGRLDRRDFWTEGGSLRWINSDDDLEAAIRYVLECQDAPIKVEE